MIREVITDLPTADGVFCDELVAVIGDAEAREDVRIGPYKLVVEYRPLSVEVTRTGIDNALEGTKKDSGLVTAVRRVPFMADIGSVKGLETVDHDEKFRVLQDWLFKYADSLSQRGYPTLTPALKYLCFPYETMLRAGVGFVGDKIDVHPLLGTRFPLRDHQVPPLRGPQLLY